MGQVTKLTFFICLSIKFNFDHSNSYHYSSNKDCSNIFRYHDTIEAYDPVRDVWENVGEMPSSRSWLSCVPLMVCPQTLSFVYSTNKIDFRIMAMPYF